MILPRRSVTVTVWQAGGKYGDFICPVCCHRATYKFTASTGWCDCCGTNFLYTDGADDAIGGDELGAHLIELDAFGRELTERP